jgi:uncharacterized YigZ family protein
MNDHFVTVAKNVRVKIPVGACRFTATVARVDSEDEAKAVIEQVSAEFNDATHNAYAFKIGLGDEALCRQSDANEPSGTAGPPMLQAIENAGLSNVVVVGTRYFGGVKLGIGGLVRAYRACAEAGLAEAGTRTEVLMLSQMLHAPYDLLGNVMREISAADGEVDGVDYSDDGVTVNIRIPQSQSEHFNVQIQEVTRGKVSVEDGHTNG